MVHRYKTRPVENDFINVNMDKVSQDALDQVDSTTQQHQTEDMSQEVLQNQDF